MENYYRNFYLSAKKDRSSKRSRSAFLPLFLIIASITLPVKRANAQASPTLSYNSPQLYAPNTVIPALTPTSSGVAAPAYSATAVSVSTGLSSPFGVAVDAGGNLYVSDLATQIVKEFPAGGGSPVIIGSGQFSHPEGITVDAAGNVYAAGDYNGQVTEIVKSDGSAVNSGTGFNEFSDVAVDAAGDIYVADFGDANSVKEILKSNGNTVPVGSGFSNYSISVATDAAGNVYVADTHLGIMEIQASTGNTVSLGSGFNNPQGVAVDAMGDVFVSDQGNGAIKEIPAGSNTPITLVSGLNNPGQIAVDGAGNIYFVDTNTNTVYEIKPVGGYYINAVPPGLSFSNSTGVLSGTTAATNTPPTNYTVTAYNATSSANAVINITVGTVPVPTLSYQSPQTYTMGQAITPLTPTSSGVSTPAYSGNKIVVGSGYNVDEAVATDAAGNVYVTDSYHNAVLKIPAGGGSQVTVASNLTGGLYGVAVDAAGNLYVSETQNNAVLKIPAGGGSPVSIGSGITGPNGLAADAVGNVYVAEHSNNDIKKISATDGSTTTIATGLGNGYGVAVDSAGNVYVAATFNNKIVKIPSGGGTPVSIGTGFSTPISVAVDAVGNVYVSDFDSKSVKMIAAGGNTTTTIATAFNYPQGVAVDGAGNVYLADGGTDVVDQLKPSGGYYINSALPTGLSFNGATGVISGTPSALSTAKNYTVTAYNLAGSAAATVNIGVVAPVTITAITRQGAAVSNSDYLTYTVTFSGAVTGLKPSNFSVSTTGGITGAYVNYVSGSGSTYNVGIFTGNGDGTETLNMINDIGMVPGVSTPFPFAGDSYTIDKQANTGLSGLVTSPTSALTQISSTQTQINYTASVSATTTSIEIKPTLSDPSGTITVNGLSVTSGSWSQSIALNTDGTPTVVTTVVTATGGVQKSYVISISKNGSSNIVLEGLQLNPNSLLTTVTNKTTQTYYTTSVSAATNSVEIKPTLSDPTGTVTVNGQAVTSGNWSQAITLNTDGKPTSVTTIVTAENGQQKNYVVIISKNGSSDVILEGLQLNPNSTLTQTSSTATQINYNTSVSQSTTSVQVKPTASDSTANITVNGTAVTSGNWSQAITLNTNGNPTVVTTVVTAGDGSQKSYVISIKKIGSSNVILEGLALNPASPLTQTSSTSKEIDYSATVSQTTSSVMVRATASDSTAVIMVDGNSVASGAWTQAILLNTDGTPTIVTTVVTSGDGTQKDYVISITKSGGTDDALMPQEPFKLELVTDVVVHQAVTPDGDGINDYLKIDGICQYPDNKLMVLNSSGAKVYEVAGYDNITKTFDGHSNTTRSLLQPGTYYYMLDYKKDNITQHKTGYFVLKY